MAKIVEEALSDSEFLIEALDERHEEIMDKLRALATPKKDVPDPVLQENLKLIKGMVEGDKTLDILDALSAVQEQFTEVKELASRSEILPAIEKLESLITEVIAEVKRPKTKTHTIVRDGMGRIGKIITTEQ